jgi:hypothetical protein
LSVKSNGSDLSAFLISSFKTILLSDQSEMYPALRFQIVQVATFGAEFDAGRGIQNFACNIDFG